MNIYNARIIQKNHVKHCVANVIVVCRTVLFSSYCSGHTRHMAGTKEIPIREIFVVCRYTSE